MQCYAHRHFAFEIDSWPHVQKREIIHKSVVESSTPEVVIQQMRAELDASEQASGSGSGGRKEKKKGFFKGLFGGKK